MPDDSRIMQGGELPVIPGTLDDVIANAPIRDTTTKPTLTQSVDFGQVYTFNERLMKFLTHAFAVVPFRQTTNTVRAVDLLSDKAIKNLVSSLGAEFFSFDALAMVSNAVGIPFLTAELKLGTEVPYASFTNGLLALMGDQDTVAYLLTTDLATALGLNDSTKPINLSDQRLLQYFPDFDRIRQLNARFVVPNDPYLLLLALDPKYRKFLSACFDRSLEDKNPPLSDWVEYTTDNHDAYGLGLEGVKKLISSGIISLPTVTKVGQKYDVKELKPYIDAINDLKKKLADATKQ